MATISTLKDELVEHLASIDKSKLSMDELRKYVDIVEISDRMVNGDGYNRFLDSAFNTLNARREPAVPMKEG